ncbi:conserved hypothetical protein [Cupriavidus taiwanensis]|uniref:UvrD-helicase domain-containing protein n=1 Tax=Cupriavidus taiwanensis TaxID=164546 RepID=UPI000E184996|nr:UvrD-helicase domain-containing protein [Cupriavidus taiwanensis]SOY93382.1 conserved hypothetical protein [Cupriavidus taiwanensis]SOY96374.1 conserved hypothetical protein [Cupriavidus taiwanensis]
MIQLLQQRTGAIEAPAGTGKTEQIALAVSSMPGRWLVLTHTVAGVEAIRRRLKKYEVAEHRVQVDTISAWAYRWARAFPLSSKLSLAWSPKSSNWESVHTAASCLIESGAVNSAFAASYDGAFVDEYQDCTTSQHMLIAALSKLMRCYILGDPLQAIFRFGKSDKMVDWHATSLQTFALVGKFGTPHRWRWAGNNELGDWLLATRDRVAAGSIDLSDAPACLKWTPCDGKMLPLELGRLCTVARQQPSETLAILDSSVSAVRRAELAKSIGGTTVEPVSGKCEREFYAALAASNGSDRVAVVLNLASTAFAGVKASEKRRRVESLIERPGKQKVPPSPAELALCAVAQSPRYSDVVEALESLERESGVSVIRPELLFSIRATLRMVVDEPGLDMEDAAWQISTLKRQRGRVVRNRSVGSTLLLKGLEFDHVVITPEGCRTRFDWYVALTRATRSVKVLSPYPRFSV